MYTIKIFYKTSEYAESSFTESYSNFESALRAYDSLHDTIEPYVHCYITKIQLKISSSVLIEASFDN